MIDSVTIVGGGTAGLTTGLILRAAYPDMKIQLIRSDTIDIVGVGEGTTEHWRDFLEFVKINPAEFFIHCGSTFKHGIYFKNWNGDGKDYLHNVPTYIIEESRIGHPNVLHKLIVENENQMSMFDEFIINSQHYQPVLESTNQYHFDTFKLNEFLNDVCAKRRIDIIVDTITSVEALGSVKKLHGEKGIYESDFYIDATGFAKVVHSQVGSDWKDCREYLPMNSAVTFPTKLDDKFPAYTAATALSSGWVWQIPTQERYGNGYVYCDDFITEDQAIEEVTKYYGHELDIRKKFKFGAGYLRNVWNKNCLAVGLSASFIEPLEATNIGTAIQQALAFVNHIGLYDPNSDSVQDSYNKKFAKVFENTVDFVQLHYFTKRKDSDFWKNSHNIKKTDFNEATIELYKKKIPLWTDFANPYALFNNFNWTMVLTGLELIDRQSYLDQWNKLPYDTKTEADIKLDVYYTREAPVLGHKEAINYIKDTYYAAN